jgi:hypothetical protein
MSSRHRAWSLSAMRLRLRTLVGPTIGAGALLAIASALSAPPARATTFVVTSAADSGAGSLRAAVTLAGSTGSDPDEIVFVDELAGATITLTSPIAADLGASGPLTINPGAGEVAGIALSGGGTSELLELDGGELTINRLTLRDGSGADGADGAATTGDGGGAGSGAIFVDVGAVLTLERSMVTGNVGGDGGDGGTPLPDIFAGGGGGGGGGGAIVNAGTLTISSSTLTANRGGDGGAGGNGPTGTGAGSGGGGGSGAGAVTNLTGAEVAIRNSTLVGNTGGDGGDGGAGVGSMSGGGGGAAGAAVVSASGGDLTIQNATIAANTSGSGGDGGAGNTGTAVQAGSGGGGGPGGGGGGGGGIGGSGLGGAGEGGDGADGSTGNATDAAGAGGGGGATFNGSSGGPGDGGGGGGNPGGQAGGLAGDGSVWAGGGGGIGGGGGGSHVIGESGGDGGGDFGGRGGGYEIDAGSGNNGGGGGGAGPRAVRGSGSVGGAAIAVAGTVTVESTILAGSLPPGGGPLTSDCRGEIDTGAANLVQTPAACTRTGGDALTGDPLLDPGGLDDNGGPTRTVVLFTGSPAIGAGANPFSLTSDQRGAGFPRLAGAVDIGAVERDELAPQIAIASPADGAVFDQGATAIASFSCADGTGGSGIESCTGTVANGAALDTATLGTHALRVTATDKSGNVSSAVRSYTVRAPAAPPQAEPRCFGRRATIVASGSGVTRGTRGPDVIVGTRGRDRIRSLGGNDRVCSRGGADVIDTAAGDDTVSAGPGNDRVRTGSGRDSVNPGSGNDRLATGSGNDKLGLGGSARDTAACGSGRRDRATADRADRVRGCETVRRATRNPG